MHDFNSILNYFCSGVKNKGAAKYFENINFVVLFSNKFGYIRAYPLFYQNF